jgi:phytoene synthase
MLDPGLRRECEEAIRAGSKSFLAASMLLPGSTRSAARALYAFCRAADDLIDESADPAEGLFEIRARLDAIYRGTPGSHPADRAFVAVVEHYAMPRALPAALIEGLNGMSKTEPTRAATSFAAMPPASPQASA